MADYLDHGGRSRGSVLYTDPSGRLPLASEEGPELDLPEVFRFSLEDGLTDVIQESVWLGDGDPRFEWRGVRPIPEDDEFLRERLASLPRGQERLLSPLSTVRGVARDSVVRLSTVRGVARDSVVRLKHRAWCGSRLSGPTEHRAWCGSRLSGPH